jgi:hypothetical protein
MHGQLTTSCPPPDVHLTYGTQVGSEQMSSVKKRKIFNFILKCTLDILLLLLKYMYLPTGECSR